MVAVVETARTEEEYLGFQRETDDDIYDEGADGDDHEDDEDWYVGIIKHYIFAIPNKFVAKI